MKARTIPWRNKPPKGFLDTLHDAEDINLFLVEDLGPTTFVFDDGSGNKIQTSIGLELACSCNNNDKIKDHCVHTLFSLLKIFKISPQNPLIWQGSYLDPEINEIVGKRFDLQPHQNIKRILKLQKRDPTSPTPPRNPIISRQKVFDGDICYICFETMNEDEGLTYCRKGCGSNFHMKCATIWAEHKNLFSHPITCAVCTFDWGEKAFQKLHDEWKEFEARGVLHVGQKCGACKSYGQKCIKGKLFHCVYCENYNLCEKCFLSFQHFEHNNYLVKETVNGEWRPAKSREKFYLKTQAKRIFGPNSTSAKQKAEVIEQRIALLNSNLAGYDDSSKDKLISDELCIQHGIAMEEFFVLCFPEYELQFKAGRSRWAPLSVVGREVKKNCSYCGSDKTTVSKLRRLICGHLLHGHCVMDMISKKSVKCPEDGLDLLRGFKSAFAGPRKIDPEVAKAIKSKDFSAGILIPKDLRLNNNLTRRRPGGKEASGSLNISVTGIPLSSTRNDELDNTTPGNNTTAAVHAHDVEKSFDFYQPKIRRKPINSSLPPIMRSKEVKEIGIGKEKFLREKRNQFSTPGKYYINVEIDTWEDEAVDNNKNNNNSNVNSSGYDLPIITGSMKMHKREHKGTMKPLLTNWESRNL